MKETGREKNREEGKGKKDCCCHQPVLNWCGTTMDGRAVGMTT